MNPILTVLKLCGGWVSQHVHIVAPLAASALLTFNIDAAQRARLVETPGDDALARPQRTGAAAWMAVAAPVAERIRGALERRRPCIEEFVLRDPQDVASEVCGALVGRLVAMERAMGAHLIGGGAASSSSAAAAQEAGRAVVNCVIKSTVYEIQSRQGAWRRCEADAGAGARPAMLAAAQALAEDIAVAVLQEVFSGIVARPGAPTPEL